MIQFSESEYLSEYLQTINNCKYWFTIIWKIVTSHHSKYHGRIISAAHIIYFIIRSISWWEVFTYKFPDNNSSIIKV